jgi:hypothetical protein
MRALASHRGGKTPELFALPANSLGLAGDPLAVRVICGSNGCAREGGIPAPSSQIVLTPASRPLRCCREPFAYVRKWRSPRTRASCSG